jgi:hypothetical protein
MLSESFWMLNEFIILLNIFKLFTEKVYFVLKELRFSSKIGLANPDHTTLLFNCYTKLKDEKKLDEFIKVRKRFIYFIISR